MYIYINNSLIKEISNFFPAEIMPKFKQRRRKLKAKAKRLFKKKEASRFQSKLTTPPSLPPSPER